MGAGAAIGSVIPGVGTAIGALAGLGLAWWRSQAREERKKLNNNQELADTKQKATNQIKEQRQKMIDAILA